MSIPFARSTRSIYADNLQPTLVGIGLFIVILLGWILWAFFAQIVFYEVSDRAKVTNDETIVASFPKETVAGLDYGIAATFIMTDTGGQSLSIPLTVLDIDQEKGQLSLVPQTPPTEILESGTAGQVKIGVQKASPAKLVLQSAGLWPSS